MGLDGNADDEDRVYRDIIDRLVHDCRHGQGQIGRERAVAGVWNVNATSDQLPEQYQVNLLLGRLTKADRQILGRILEEEFVSGVHSAFVALHEAQLEPFDKAYEGTPFHDFIGRLDDWKWPEKSRRS